MVVCEITTGKPSMSGKPKIGTWAAWRAMTAVHNAGGDTSTVLKQAGLTEDIVSQTNHRIDYRQNLQFFEACATHLPKSEW